MNRFDSRRRLPLRSLTAFFFVAAVLAGCSDPYGGRMAVSGGVKLEGQPLKAGQITFMPLEKENKDTQSGAAIKDGHYSIDRPHGLKPGKYLVQLTAGEGKTPANEEIANPGGSANIVSVDLIPEEWNTRSKKEVEVKSSGTNNFDFDIPTMNPRAKKKR